MKYSVVVSFSLEGLHCWPSAKDIFPEVSFLSDMHRHIFGFKCYATVTHTDRDIEFIILKRKLINFLNNNYLENNVLKFDTLSCEAIGEILLKNFPELYKVEVWEDWENGAIIEL